MRRIAALLLLMQCSSLVAGAEDQPAAEWKQFLLRLEAKIERLSAQLEAQSAQIEAQRKEVRRLRETLSPGGSAVSRFAEARGTDIGTAVQAQALRDTPAAEAEKPPRSAAGFRFSGDFRYRFDLAARHPNAVAGPLQNARMRYRLRFNADRDISDRFRVRLQLATGALTNTLVNDQDFTSAMAKHLFTITEAYVDYRPNARLRLRGGRMEEIFDDDSRFVFDHDARFNGFHEILAVSGAVELRAAQYIFSNPAVPFVTLGSPLALAGARLGSRGRSANLFHQGVVLHRGGQEFIADLQLLRNPNQLQLSVVPAGIGFVSTGLGVQLAAPLTGLGNATTTPGGAQLSARHYQVLRLAYKLSGRAPLPRRPYGRLDLQVARNLGAGTLRDAMIATVQVGRVKKLGDVSGLYLFTIKDANSIIAAFTDTDLGTSSTVNIRAHHFRVDVGLAPFLQFQNLLFFTNFRRASNPADRLFVPFERGARETVRYQSQLQFVF